MRGWTLQLKVSSIWLNSIEQPFDLPHQIQRQGGELKTRSSLDVRAYQVEQAQSPLWAGVTEIRLLQNAATFRCESEGQAQSLGRKPR